MKLNSSFLPDCRGHWCSSRRLWEAGSHQGTWATYLQPQFSVYRVHCLTGGLAVNLYAGPKKKKKWRKLLNKTDNEKQIGDYISKITSIDSMKMFEVWPHCPSLLNPFPLRTPSGKFIYVSHSYKAWTLTCCDQWNVCASDMCHFPGEILRASMWFHQLISFSFCSRQICPK